jgi:PST family polysaccharide transporter
MNSDDSISINSEKKVSLSKNIFWVTFASLFGKVLTFISSIIVARILYPDDFGIIGMAATFSGLVEVFSRLGLEAYIISNQDIKKEGVNSVYILNILLGIVFGGIMMLCGPVVSWVYKTPEVKYILFFSGLTFLIYTFTSVQRALIVKQMRQDLTSKIEIIQNFINVGLIISFALMGFRYLSFVIPQLITGLIVCGIYFSITKWRFTTVLDKTVIKQALVYGKSFMPKTLLCYLIYNSDYIFVGYLLGSNLLGYYYFGFEKALIFVTIVSNISVSIFFPQFSKVQKNPEELSRTFFSLVEKQTYIMYPLLFTQILLAKEFMNVIYGTRWDNSIFTFVLISCYAFGRVVALIIHVLFDAVGQPQHNFKHFRIATPICLLGIFIGTKLGGLIGVSIAACIVHIFTVFILLVRTGRVFNWKFSEIMLYSTKSFIPILIMLPIVVPLKLYLSIIHVKSIVILLTITPLCFILYLLFTRIFLKDLFDSTIVMTFNKLTGYLKPVQNLKEESV